MPLCPAYSDSISEVRISLSIAAPLGFRKPEKKQKASLSPYHEKMKAQKSKASYRKATAAVKNKWLL